MSSVGFLIIMPALYFVKGSKYIKLNPFLFYYYPSTYYPRPRGSMSPSDESLATDFLPISFLHHFRRREAYALFIEDNDKNLIINYLNLNKKDKERLVRYEVPIKYSISFHRFVVEASAFASWS